VIAGPVGVGKTRLAVEAARAATKKGYATAHVVGTRAASSIPFGAFAPLLPEVDVDARWLLHFLRQATDGIVDVNRSDQGLLLVVDDAHQLDNGSAALLHQLARAMDNHRRGHAGRNAAGPAGDCQRSSLTQSAPRFRRA
jgi:predicted ATPase